MYNIYQTVVHLVNGNGRRLKSFQCSGGFRGWRNGGIGPFSWRNLELLENQERNSESRVESGSGIWTRRPLTEVLSI